MMKYYFESQERQGRLKEILISWIGTPHKHKGRVKGRAVDCINLVGMILIEMGIINKFEVPDYASDWHLHRSKEILYNGILEQVPCVDIDPNGQLMNGDILLFKYGRASAHSTIYFDGYLYQSFNYQAVRKAEFKHQQSRVSFGLRVIEI